jgi:hypothetical protein
MVSLAPLPLPSGRTADNSVQRPGEVRCRVNACIDLQKKPSLSKFVLIVARLSAVQLIFFRSNPLDALLKDANRRCCGWNTPVC